MPKKERQKKVSGPVIKKTAHAKKINGDAKDLSSLSKIWIKLSEQYTWQFQIAAAKSF